MSVKEKEKDLEKQEIISEDIDTNLAEPTEQSETKNTNIDKSVEKSVEKFVPVKEISENNNQNEKSVFSIFKILLIILFVILTCYNMLNSNIISGVHIKGYNVSHLSKSDAKYQLEKYVEQNLPEEITLKYGDFETSISLSQIDTSFDIKSATDSAYHIGRQGNIFQNNLYILSAMFGKVNIEPRLIINKEQLSKNLEDISTQLPDAVIQSSYYIEDSNLIITPGKDCHLRFFPW